MADFELKPNEKLDVREILKDLDKYDDLPPDVIDTLSDFI
jgi:hypothetical protein